VTYQRGKLLRRVHPASAIPSPGSEVYCCAHSRRRGRSPSNAHCAFHEASSIGYSRRQGGRRRLGGPLHRPQCRAYRLRRSRRGAVFHPDPGHRDHHAHRGRGYRRLGLLRLGFYALLSRHRRRCGERGARLAGIWRPAPVRAGRIDLRPGNAGMRRGAGHGLVRARAHRSRLRRSCSVSA
jgi:hypothetical protein